MTTVMPLFGPLLALLLLAPVAADDSPQEKEAVCFIAEVRWVALEGGFFGLIADGGEKFLPLNLPEDFKKKGLKVRIRGEVKKVMSISMWGKPLKILDIEPD